MSSCCSNYIGVTIKSISETTGPSPLMEKIKKISYVWETLKVPSSPSKKKNNNPTLNIKDECQWNNQY